MVLLYSVQVYACNLTSGLAYWIRPKCLFVLSILGRHCLGISSTDEQYRFCVLSMHREGGIIQHSTHSKFLGVLKFRFNGGCSFSCKNLLCRVTNLISNRSLLKQLWSYGVSQDIFRIITFAYKVIEV